MATPTTGMNDADYRGELSGRLSRAKEIAREAIASYEKEGSADAEKVAKRAIEVARSLNAAMAGPTMAELQAPTGSVVAQTLGEFNPVASTQVVNPNAMVDAQARRESNIYGRSAMADRSPLDTPLDLAVDVAKGIDKTIGAGVQGVVDTVSLNTSDEIYGYIDGLLSDRDPNESSEAYKQYREEQKTENAAAYGAGGAAGMFALPLPKFAGVQSPVKQGILQGGTYGAVSEAGKAEEGDRLTEGLKGGFGGAFFGGIASKVISTAGPLADSLRNFKLKGSVKKLESKGTVEALKDVEKATYEAVPKNVNLFKDGSEVIRAIDKVKIDRDHLPVKGGPVVVEKVEGMIRNAFERNNGKLTPIQYKNLRTNLMSQLDDTGESVTARLIINTFDDIAQKNMASIGDKTLLQARNISSQVRKAELFDTAFKEAKVNISKLGQKADALTVYRNTAERVLNSADAKYLSPAERELVTQFITGGTAVKRLEGMLASMSPSASNFWAMAHVAGALSTGNPLMLLTMAATEGSRIGLNRSTIVDAEKLIKQLGGLDVVKKNLNSPEMVRTLAAFGYDQSTLTELLFPAVEKR